MIRVLLLISILSFSIRSGAEEPAWPWRPFAPVQQPPVPAGAAPGISEIDAFLIEAQRRKGTRFSPSASPDALLRRVYLDLIGLAPAPEERAAFLADTAPDAYEKVVDRLLADPRHAERWARHWMDVWRYSDWAGWSDGNQIRDSQPHIWRWRDWIVESLHADVGYDRMIIDMLAADERAPEDPSALRATGFLVRNYKMLSREQWMEDTVKHTGMALMGLTVGCAKCHDHLTDPLKQTDYFALRAVFEPHQVRIDPVPGQADTAKDGLARVFDADLEAPTHVFHRGDERAPDRDRIVAPGPPEFLGGEFMVEPVDLPPLAVSPHRRESVRIDLEAAAKAAVETAPHEEKPYADAKYQALRAVFAVERLEEAGKKDSPEWEEAARTAAAAQREEDRAGAARELQMAIVAHGEAVQKDAASAAEFDSKIEEARKALAAAEAVCAQPPVTAFKPRDIPSYPARSTGRRLALARWLTRPENPLTARVAVNHLWARHFGTGLAPMLSDLGNGARPPEHPALLDWLAADFMAHGWSFRRLHRLLCLSAAYRQSSAVGEAAEAMQRADPDNLTLWRFPSRRLEAEAVRDNALYVTGGLALTRGGPELDQSLIFASPRRSLYFRCAAEKQPEFLQVFDGPSVVECYERKSSVVPQQALALWNSEFAHARARAAAALYEGETDAASVVRGAFIRFLTREPAAEELRVCLEFLGSAGPRQRELFFLTMLNHHEFVTLR
ncbi:MAG TPA: DUF1549 and DUF1553 domain-containing protein [Verrucomicrobiales bacterium]|nr:DUF1549 and DUF1553 domain-containing protein [Verrucomicrobiales bacterium]